MFKVWWIIVSLGAFVVLQSESLYIVWYRRAPGGPTVSLVLGSF
jgi:hypothetical protein